MVKCSLNLISQYLAEVEQEVLFPARFVQTVPGGVIFLAAMTLAASWKSMATLMRQAFKDL